jgi:hypothetical protein
MAHLGMLKSIPAHELNLFILLICSCIAFMLLVKVAKSFA